MTTTRAASPANVTPHAARGCPRGRTLVRLDLRLSVTRVHRIVESKEGVVLLLRDVDQPVDRLGQFPKTAVFRTRYGTSPGE